MNNSVLFFKSNIVDSNSSLVAHFKLDSNSNDSLYGLLGTDSGGVAYSSGKISNSANYNGFEKVSTITDNDYFSFVSGGNDSAASINCWVKFDSVSGINFILSKKMEPNSREWILAYNSTFFTFILQIPGATAFIRANASFTPTVGLWYMLTVTYDGSKSHNGIDIYINSSLQSSTKSVTGTYTGMVNSTSPLRIGNSDINSEYFKGSIDEVSIWKNRKLLKVDIDYLYNSGAGRTYPF